MRKFALLLAAPMALISFPALAQETESKIEIVSLEAHPSDIDIGKQKTWARPNVDPYSGDIDGAAFLGKVTDIRPLELRESWNMRIRGECHRYQFDKKDVFRTTFGKNKSMLANPGFTGWSDVCIVRDDGTAVVYPDDCKNIGPAKAIIKRLEKTLAEKPEDLPAKPVLMTSSMSAASEPNAGNSTLMTGGIYSPTYRGGKSRVNVHSKSAATGSATSSSGNCTTCGSQPGHISGE